MHASHSIAVYNVQIICECEPEKFSVTTAMGKLLFSSVQPRQRSASVCHNYYYMNCGSRMNHPPSVVECPHSKLPLREDDNLTYLWFGKAKLRPLSPQAPPPGAGPLQDAAAAAPAAAVTRN